ncbi:MAG TPA: ABC transporter substrate-binding protein [Rhodopila sp.]
MQLRTPMRVRTRIPPRAPIPPVATQSSDTMPPVATQSSAAMQASDTMPPGVATQPTLTRRGLLASSVAAGAIALLSTPHIARAQAKTLIVTCYGGAYEKLFREQLIPTFEKETGATVRLVLGLAKDNIPLLRAAGIDNPPLDVCMTNEVIAEILRTEGYFTALPEDKVTNLKDVAPIARYPGDMAVTGMLQPVGIAYRTDTVSDPVTSWKGLFERPDLKGQIGMYNITNSLGFMFVLMMARIYGGSETAYDAAFKQIQTLKPFSQVDFSGTMEIQLTRGEVDVAPLDFAAVMRLQRQGVPVDAKVPSEGMVAFDQVFNVTKGSKSKDLAFAWVDYFLRPETQQKLVNGFFISPTNLKTVIPPELATSPIMITGDRLQRVVRHDWATANRQRDKIVEQWNRLMT